MSNYPTAPVNHSDEKEHRRKLANTANLALAGKLNNRGVVTLTNSSTTSVVVDPRVEEDSVIHMMPSTSDAASEAWHILAANITLGQFTITHSSDSTTRTFRYTVTG